MWKLEAEAVLCRDSGEQDSPLPDFIELYANASSSVVLVHFLDYFKLPNNSSTRISSYGVAFVNF